MSDSLFSRLSRNFVSFAFQNSIAQAVEQRVSLAVRALDDIRDRPWGSSEKYPRDRYAHDRQEVLQDVLLEWRVNPIMRRIVELTTDFVIGSGISIESEDETANEFLQAWWSDDLNSMGLRVFEWCDELTRGGELFPVLSTDVAGMTYVRAYPASEITDIKTVANDVEQELTYIQKPEDNSLQERPWPAYDHRTDTRSEDGTFSDVMLHFAVNRPVGASRGESDLAPITKWANRYCAWLEDRVRLNHFRQSFLYVVYKKFKSTAEKIAEQLKLNANPPTPGSILLAEIDQEKWDVIHPKLDSFEAERDGLAIKKLIALGAGVPLHFLAEPESSTRTTAEQADDPSHRHYERRQIFFKAFILRVARVALRRRAMVDRKIQANASIIVKTPDIYSRDNAQLAQAAKAIIESFIPLHDKGLITDEELLRLSYRFAGELVDIKQILADAKKQNPNPTPTPSEKPTEPKP